MSKRKYKVPKNQMTLSSKKREMSVCTKIPKELAVSSSHDYVLTNQEEMDILSRYILDYKDIETGGQLFGYWTFDGKPVVLFVLGPGPQAGHYGSFFMQDLDYLRTCARILKEKYGLDHVGEWHSHHQLGLDHPSGHDARNISTNMRSLGYKKFLLCIATCNSFQSSINAFMFDSNKSQYEQIPWYIKAIESPYRGIINSNTFILPTTKSPNMVGLYTKGISAGHEMIEYEKSYWLTQKGNSKILKSIIDKLKYLHPQHDFVPTLDESNEVHIEIYQNDFLLEDIHFPSAFPLEPPRISDPYGRVTCNQAMWKYNGDIYFTFITYYNNLIKNYNYDDSE